MKLVTLKNVSDKRIVVTQVRGFRVESGDTVKVPPATVTHPAVSQYIGNGLELVDGEDTKVEPIAPATIPEETPPVSEPTAGTEDAPKDEVAEDEVTEDDVVNDEVTEDEVVEDSDSPEEPPSEEMAGTLRDSYINAPGITEGNVDAVMIAYPTHEALATASKDDLVSAGVSKSYVKRLTSWASEL